MASTIHQRYSEIQAAEDFNGLLILEAPETFQEHFEEIKILGQGGFGSVLCVKPLEKARQKIPALSDGKICAAKSLRLPRRDVDVESIEASSIKVPLGRHLEVLQLLGSHQTNENYVLQTFAKIIELPRQMYIVMDMLGGPDLLDWLCERQSRIPEVEIKKMLRQMFTGLHYLHRVVGLLHRDVKPENFGFALPVASEGPLPPLKIFDFGLVFVLHTPITEASASALLPAPLGGTPQYMAPEAWQQRFGAPSDIWGVGIIMHMLLVGRPPFGMELCEELHHFSRATQQELDFSSDDWRAVSASAQQFLTALLEKDVNRRLTTTAALAHDSWLSNPSDSPVSMQSSPRSPHLSRASTRKSVRFGELTYYHSLAFSHQTHRTFSMEMSIETER